ncbi:MAG: hypothetical protein GYA02_07790 [Clostridiaceae bacterium]|jgi:hypothetical protein|nr:hypothetical protein [Clostridiaceae bacterium]
MSGLNQKSEREAKIKQKVNTDKKATDNELDLDELDQVVGGVSLSRMSKVETTDINDNTRSKI